MAYVWQYGWWPFIAEYDARDLVGPAVLYTRVTVGSPPPASDPPPPDWSPPDSSVTPAGDIVPPPLPPPTVPHPGVGPIYGDQVNAIVGGELVYAVTSSVYGGDGTPDFVMCPLVPSIPENLETTPCEVLTDYAGSAVTSVLDAATVWTGVGPSGITSSLGPVYYVVEVTAAISGGDEAAEGCARPGWTVVDPVCGPGDFATSNVMDIGGGTDVWFDLPDDTNVVRRIPAAPHQERSGRKQHSPLIGDFGAGDSYLDFAGYLVNPAPHPEVINHRDADGYLYRPTVDQVSPRPSDYELPYECYFTWEEVLLIPDLSISTGSRSHHFPRAVLRCYVIAWRPNPIQPDPGGGTTLTPSTVVAALGPDGVVPRERDVVGG